MYRISISSANLFEVCIHLVNFLEAVQGKNILLSEHNVYAYYVTLEQNILPLHCVSKNVRPLVCYNFEIRERILIFLAEMLPIK